MSARARKILFFGLLTAAGCSGAAADGRGPLGSHYVRLDLGAVAHDAGKFNQEGLSGNGGVFVDDDFGGNVALGAGLGWHLWSNVRFDVTGEYRSNTDVDARDFLHITTPTTDIVASTKYSGEYSAIVALANLYLDLPKLYGVITPYVGAGIGIAYNRFTRFDTLTTGTFTDLVGGASTDILNSGFASSKHTTEFAWAVMAGASVELDERRVFEVGYRYTDLGGDISASTGLIDCTCGSQGDPLTVSDLHSHELRIGVRLFFQNMRELVPVQ